MAERRWWGHRSIRSKTTAIATLLIVVVLAATMLLLASLQQRSLTENLHDAIEQRADDLSDLLAAGATDVLITSGGEDTIAQVVHDDVVTAAAAVIQGAPPIAQSPTRPGDTWTTKAHLGRDGEAALVLSRNIDTPTGPVTLHVAGSLGDIKEASRALHRALLVLVPGAAVVLGAATWWLVGKTLSPVEAIRTEVDEIGAQQLHRRVPQPPGHDEIARLASTMNSMLERVEAAHGAQERFVADASHELRTPLTRIRTELEVALRDPAQSAAAANNQSLLDEAVLMQHLVDDLLLLASVDAGAQLGGQRTIDLDDLVYSEAERLRGLGRRAIDVSNVHPAQVVGDPHRLRRAIANIADNAERHAAGAVTFILDEADGMARLDIIDDGPGVPEALHKVIFQRFGRHDARSGSDGGAGLGLPIARDIIHAMHGTVELDLRHHPGSRFTIRLPVAPN